MSEYRWQWMTPDRPGVWAFGGRMPGNQQGTWCVMEVDSQYNSNPGWWCFLMPMPEIKPPKKKAVWRLWVVPRPGFKTEFWSSWVPDGSKPENTNAIRTDKTEERE